MCHNGGHFPAVVFINQSGWIFTIVFNGFSIFPSLSCVILNYFMANNNIEAWSGPSEAVYDPVGSSNGSKTTDEIIAVTPLGR